MIRLNYTVVYPQVNYSNPGNDPVIARWSASKELRGSIYLENDSLPREEACDMLFAGFGNHPEVSLPRWKMAQVRSMSIGDVVNFENSDVYYICDSCGWLTVTKDQADSWLAFPRKYGCDMFELKAWKIEVGLDK